MTRKEPITPKEPERSELAEALAKLKGTAHGLDITRLDGTMLWLSVTLLAARKASLSLGVTQDGSSWSLQVWDGKFPVKDYFRDTDELNHHLAAMVKVMSGKEISQEVAQLVEAYGW